MKWTVLGDAENLERYQLMSEVLNQRGCKNEFEVWPHQSLNFETFEELKAYDHVRLARQWATVVPKNLTLQSSWSSLLGVGDGMIRKDGKWWPMCALYEAFSQLLKDIGHQLDLSASVMVAGSGAAARIAVAVFFKAGFRNFLISSFDESEANKMIQEINSRMFGLSIRWIAKDKIVLLPGETSALVNCTLASEENTLLAELCYLNFLKRPGLLIDLPLAKENNQLIIEALDSGVNVFAGGELAARVDVQWAEWAFDCSLDLPEYHKIMRERLKLSDVVGKTAASVVATSAEK